MRKDSSSPDINGAAKKLLLSVRPHFLGLLYKFVAWDDQNLYKMRVQQLVMDQIRQRHDVQHGAIQRHPMNSAGLDTTCLYDG